MKEDFLEELFQLIEKRKKADSNDSYVKYLQEAGTSKINEKILEETLELLEASSETTIDKKEKIIHETADLWFHVCLLYTSPSPRDRG